MDILKWLDEIGKKSNGLNGVRDYATLRQLLPQTSNEKQSQYDGSQNTDGTTDLSSLLGYADGGGSNISDVQYAPPPSPFATVNKNVQYAPPPSQVPPPITPLPTLVQPTITPPPTTPPILQQQQGGLTMTNINNLMNSLNPGQTVSGTVYGNVDLNADKNAAIHNVNNYTVGINDKIMDNHNLRSTQTENAVNDFNYKVQQQENDAYGIGNSNSLNIINAANNRALGRTFLPGGGQFGLPDKKVFITDRIKADDFQHLSDRFDGQSYQSFPYAVSKQLPHPVAPKPPKQTAFFWFVPGANNATSASQTVSIQGTSTDATTGRVFHNPSQAGNIGKAISMALPHEKSAFVDSKTFGTSPSGKPLNFYDAVDNDILEEMGKTSGSAWSQDAKAGKLYMIDVGKGQQKFYLSKSQDGVLWNMRTGNTLQIDENYYNELLHRVVVSMEKVMGKDPTAWDKASTGGKTYDGHQIDWNATGEKDVVLLHKAQQWLATNLTAEVSTSQGGTPVLSTPMLPSTAIPAHTTGVIRYHP